MYPLGSCTMKYNPRVNEVVSRIEGIADAHPYRPESLAQGCLQIMKLLSDCLLEITGMDAITLQPAAGAHGEFTGILLARAYHESKGNARKKILIPDSAHGTNPATAAAAGYQVANLKSNAQGMVDIAELERMVDEDTAALMLTNPSTIGVFESEIHKIADILHAKGALLYMDGANMNAQVGLTSPGFIGADVCHLNLHKTFCIPHGGGGPGMGPICVAEHLAGFLPGHPVVNLGGEDQIGPVAAAPWGSAGILPISWMYIAMMGADGLTEATKFAILNANYIAKRLENYFPTLYRGHGGLVAHECILDLRRFKNVTAEDVAKRLMDYSFHAPTLSWPVAGTLMVEPTESESKFELDRFCDAMIAIHGEMQAIESGAADRQNNLLKNAPHTADVVAADNWDRPYPRESAAFPVKSLRDYKFWPAVGRVDNVYGDRNPVCTCAGMGNYS